MASRASTFASATLSAFHAPGLSERYHGIRVQVSQIQEQRHIDVFGFGLALGRDGGGEGRGNSSHIHGFDTQTRTRQALVYDGVSQSTSTVLVSCTCVLWCVMLRLKALPEPCLQTALQTWHLQDWSVSLNLLGGQSDDVADKSPEQAVEHVEVLQSGHFHLPVC